MTATSSYEYEPLAETIAHACAITFQGNASNGLQQDAFFFLDHWYQEDLGVMPVTSVQAPFCLAVSDGVASSNQSQHCSKAVVKAIKKLWDSNQESTSAITSDHIYTQLSQTKHPKKRYGAAATLAMITGTLNDDKSINIDITHVGDSRVYLLSKDMNEWQCLTRDHNLLNELVDEQAHNEGREAQPSEYNRTGMAGSLYSITECFALAVDSDDPSSEPPKSDKRTITVQAGDSLVICTDGIHDLVSCYEWSLIDNQTDLQGWLQKLMQQVYDSDGNAYDNGTAIVVRFD
ncbi:protein phosphatase 2C domain-containing protein [Psychrobacter sp. 5A.1]|uniref:PP2C family protein-serine/threonine phosphatase n=2 Tax=unclassified Psychrobacter TaxID=196806 RepID=UPI0025B2DA19|nr:protein phosphatase 2C domain-containing protein [Psychrobacter sp. 5A.1]MDN3503576.1 protein phosphatase 2C domain-containing protein [Psychrobacter sp. 5A.1]